MILEKNNNMAYRIEVSYKKNDARAKIIFNKIKSLGFKSKLQKVFLTDIYTINKQFTNNQLKQISSILHNPVSQNSMIKKPLSPLNFNWAIEIGYLPGVTDNTAKTAKEIIEDYLCIKFNQSEEIYTSQVIYLSGKLTQKNVQSIAEDLANSLIQRIHIKTYHQFKKDQGMDIIVPKVKLIEKPVVNKVNLNVSDEELITIGKKGIANKDKTRRGPLALDLTYMKTIQSYFKKQNRNPTDIELESIAQTWSEHCKHTIFADPMDEIKDGLYKTYIQKATQEIRKSKGKKDFCFSVFTDNSGAIVFNKDYLVTDKVETHNSPSALDPFGGAITGIVGVNRDTIGFGLGAKPIINRYGYCFTDPKNTTPLYRDSQLKQKMLSPKRIMQGVINGVNVGGNCSGIPTPQGFMIFDPRYKGKPLVFVGTVGLIPKKIANKKSHLKKARPGDYIVVIGGRVGLDGIHGATFSSEALDSGSPSGAVQIGDPITQKKLSDALVKEANKQGLFNSLTDNGAGGLSCSVAEMAKESNGCFVHLEKVPLKYPNLAPWQIWISESQERMTLAVPKNKWKKFAHLMKQRGVEATIIGQFTKSGKCIVKYENQTIVNIQMEFLHNGLPPRPMKTIYVKPKLKEPIIPKKTDLTKTFLSILSRPNIASFEFISQQYDYEVQGTSVLKPLQGKGRINSNATVIKPILKSKKGVVISQGINPSYSDIDTYHMASCAIDTAIRNAVSVGADIDYLALLDNFCWCSSNEPERLGQLKKATQACYDYALFYKTPFISGKDSMFNDFKGYDKKGQPLKISVPPTLLISSISVIPNINKVVSLDAKFPNDLIYLLGETKDELGGSEYFSLFQSIGTKVPQVNGQKNKQLYKSIYQAIQKELISSAQSIGRGGLGVAIAKTAMGGMLGVKISLKNIFGSVGRDDYALFSESQGRLIVTINPKKKKLFEKTMKNNPFKLIGKVTKKQSIIIKGLTNKIIVNTTLDKALKSYRSTFKNI